MIPLNSKTDDAKHAIAARVQRFVIRRRAQLLTTNSVAQSGWEPMFSIGVGPAWLKDLVDKLGP